MRSLLLSLITLLILSASTAAQPGMGPGPGLGQPFNPAISFIGQCAAATTSCTPPTHAVGDLFVAAAGRDASNAAPTLPSGWTSVTTASINGASTNDSALLIACKVATTSSETATGFTNAGWLVVQIYRGQAAGNTATCASGILGTPSNFTSAPNTTTTTVSYIDPANSPLTANAGSWVVGFGLAPAATAGLGTAPSGMSNRSLAGSTKLAGHDTAAGVSSFSTANVTVTGAGRVLTSVIEIKN